MRIYLAPLEGVTKIFFRNIYHKYFKNVDKMYIPFIEPTSSRSLTVKEKREMLPEKNVDTFSILVPQIISNNVEDTIYLMEQAKIMGYKEVNLNFGCPSPTVTTKGKGSGILKDLNKLDNYLNEIFSRVKNLQISIKMRIGFYNVDEFKDVLNIINKYDVYELIIHPRTTQEKYAGYPHLDVLNNLNELTNIPIIYNGDIKSISDIEYIQNRFPYLKGIMLGRGLIERPFILSNDNSLDIKQTLKDFYFEILDSSTNELGWNNSKYFAKEIWAYLQNSFIIPQNLAKKPFKQEKYDDYKNVLLTIFDECELNLSNELSESFKQ